MRVDSRARPATAGPGGAYQLAFLFFQGVSALAWLELLPPRERLLLADSSTMKRNGTEALSPIKPPRTVHVRLSQADTQPALRAPAVRLSQADTVVAPTPDVPALTEAAGWVTSSVTDLPPPECTPCPPLEELPPPSCGMSASSCCGTLPPPAPAPVSGPAPTIHIMHGDIFARARIAAVQSRVAAGSKVPFHDGSYWCSKCPRRGFQSAEGLMRHITHLHTGSVVDEDTCALLEAIERVTCSTPSCGGLRRSGARLCNRCGMATPARPPAVDDLIMGAFGAPTAEAGAAGAEENDTPPIPTARVELPSLQLPENFTQRIRSLPANTLLHRFGDLLQRAEEECLILRMAGNRKIRDVQPDPSARADRARPSAAVGAYRKATTGLVSSLLSFEEKEDFAWAKELLPTSTLGGQAHSAASSG